MTAELTRDEAAHAALRARQGAGARYDAAAAPTRTLSWARRGTAYFARKLNELRDEDLAAPSLVPGWTRRHVIAHIGYHARALARLVEWARTGIEQPICASEAARAAEIALGATLPAQALRNLFHHAEVHLSVEWRDLTDAAWEARVRDLDGRPLPIRATPAMRAREVWIGAADLDNGGSFSDFPPALIDALIAEAALALEGHAALVLAPGDRAAPVPIGRNGPTVSGSAADIARWLTGRGAYRLDCAGGSLPILPHLAAPLSIEG
ncbi:MAG TPA: maleylpyruvate isomerase family mycothiol-dependent enzyme [Paracoccaceae bacterium]|nr:maleylpyruvate isomerase family mycothiol-dependent enzyme [Paracoccaceae bacterium]